MGDGDHMDYRSLGEILRDAREGIGKSIDELSEMTKISPRMIAALESDDLEQIASPVYARGFIRTLADSLDLDVEWLSTKLETASAGTRPSQSRVEEADQTTWNIEQVRVRRVEKSRSMAVPLPLVLGAVAVVIVGLVAWWFLRGSRGSDVDSSAPPPATVPEQHAELEPQEAPGQPEQQLLPQQELAVEQEAEHDDEGLEAVDGSSTPMAINTPVLPPQDQLVLAGGGPVNFDEQAPEEEGAAAPESAGEQAQEDEAKATPEDPAEESAATEDPAPSRQAAAPAEAPEEQVVLPPSGQGLASIVRPGVQPTRGRQMELQILATSTVEVWAGADGAARAYRRMVVDEAWTLTADDHFSLRLSDPEAVRVTLDGRERRPPAGATGEWLIYPVGGDG